MTNCEAVAGSSRFNPFIKRSIAMTRFSLIALFIGVALVSITSANDKLQYPLDVAATADGKTVYIADRKLPGIWKVEDGKLSPFFTGSKKFRTPLNAVRCVAVAEDGTVFAGDSSTREVYRFDGEKPIPLTKGAIGIPSALAISGDDIYVADLELQRIWKFPKSGGKPEEVLVQAAVRGLAFDEQGKLLCMTTLEDPLKRIADDGAATTLVKGRPFDMPHHLARVDSAVYCPDNYSNAIWKITLSETSEVTKFTTGEPMQKPVGICAVPDGLLVADPHAREVFHVKMDGTITKLITTK